MNSFVAFSAVLLFISVTSAGERVPAELSSVSVEDPAAVYSEQLTDSLPFQYTATQYLADIQIHSSAELLEILQRVEQLTANTATQPQSDNPVVFLLHGKEARSLLQQNYQQNRQLVDLAARLAAFEVVDIKVCEVWMDNQRLDKTQLQPFVGTVPFAPAEKKRLVEERGYQYF